MTSGIGRPTRLALATGAVLCAAALLVGCTPAEPDTSPPPQPTVTTQPSEPPVEPTPSGPVLVPEGSATENLPLFTQVVADVWAGESRVRGHAYIDALTAAGFDRTAMQVTKDVTSIGRPAESIQFAVAWDDEECLVGQVGPSTGEPVTAVMPRMAEISCIVGELSPIGG